VDPPTPNRKISSDVRLACAWRYFAGASPGDIMTTYKISLSSVLLSVWGVVEAVNRCWEFHIEYPASHDVQRSIAADFAAVSDVGFTACAGAIDGVLICIGKPSEKDAKESGYRARSCSVRERRSLGLTAKLCPIVAEVWRSDVGLFSLRSKRFISKVEQRTSC
jgi:hypothetical protein